MHRLHLDVVILLRRWGADICELNIERDLPLHDARSTIGPDSNVLLNAMGSCRALNHTSDIAPKQCIVARSVRQPTTASTPLGEKFPRVQQPQRD